MQVEPLTLYDTEEAIKMQNFIWLHKSYKAPHKDGIPEELLK
jgi:hypothetical protein